VTEDQIDIRSLCEVSHECIPQNVPKTIGQVKWNGVTKTLLCFYSIHWPLGLSDSVSYILDKSACKHKN